MLWDRMVTRSFVDDRLGIQSGVESTRVLRSNLVPTKVGLAVSETGQHFRRMRVWSKTVFGQGIHYVNKRENQENQKVKINKFYYI
jgi:hypothetical protein